MIPGIPMKQWKFSHQVDAEITSYKFEASKNSALSSDVEGIITVTVHIK